MHMRPRMTGLLLPVALLLLLPGAALAAKKKSVEKKAAEQQDWEESDKLPTVQNRLYRMQHEFNLGVGVLPVDAFAKGVTFSGGYGWHITDLWAVEGHFYYLRNLKTSLRDKLENNFGEPPSKFAEISMYGELGVLFKPIYGKLSLFNRTLVYGDLYLSLAAVVARMNGGKATDDEPQGKGPRMAYGAAPGFGIRGYLSRHFSLRLDFRYMLLYSAGEGHFPLALTLSAAFTPRSDL
jgi:outer membrane beta-barrel protein